MPRLCTAFLAIIIMMSSPVLAEIPRAVRDNVPDAKVVGEARLKVFVWKVYDAVLYAPNGNWSYEKPFALQLTYLRELDGKEIAKRSVKEIKEQGFSDVNTLASWGMDMQNIFPDVSKGSVLTGLYIPNQPTSFYDETKKIGMVKDAAFGRPFFDIWLGKKTSEPELRKQLIGLP